MNTYRILRDTGKGDEVHAEGCRDIARAAARYGETGWTFTAEPGADLAYEAARDTYEDHIFDYGYEYDSPEAVAYWRECAHGFKVHNCAHKLNTVPEMPDFSDDDVPGKKEKQAMHPADLAAHFKNETMRFRFAGECVEGLSPALGGTGPCGAADVDSTGRCALHAIASKEELADEVRKLSERVALLNETRLDLEHRLHCPPTRTALEDKTLSLIERKLEEDGDDPLELYPDQLAAIVRAVRR